MIKNRQNVFLFVKDDYMVLKLLQTKVHCVYNVHSTFKRDVKNLFSKPYYLDTFLMIQILFFPTLTWIHKNSKNLAKQFLGNCSCRRRRYASSYCCKICKIRSRKLIIYMIWPKIVSRLSIIQICYTQIHSSNAIL